jgi:protein required for attachment to host cells
MLIANAVAARVLALDDAQRLVPVHRFEHEAGRLPTRVLARDRAGWAESAAHTRGSALVPPTDAHRREREKFAHELAAWLEDAALHARFERLDVFAAPAFLGELHGALHGATRRLLGELRPVDLTHVGPAELPARVRDELARVEGQGA